MPRPVEADLALAPAVAHTLQSLAEFLGKPEAGLLEAFLEGSTEAERVAKGQKIATPRLLVDDRRLYSMAYDVWTSATPAQKDHLRGFSAELLSLAVHHAIELDASSLRQARAQGPHRPARAAGRLSSPRETGARFRAKTAKDRQAVDSALPISTHSP